jgi:hypothetical protein
VLKITINETAAERRWILQGRLVEVWRRQDEARCIIDLNNVTFIDKRGERLLRAMAKQGAQFVASGVYIRHILEQVITNGRPNLTRLLCCLFAGFVASVIYLFPPRTKADLPERPAQFGVATRTTASNRPGSGDIKSQIEGAWRCNAKL